MIAAASNTTAVACFATTAWPAALKNVGLLSNSQWHSIYQGSVAISGFRSVISQPCWHLDAIAVKGISVQRLPWSCYVFERRHPCYIVSSVLVDWRKPTCWPAWCYQIMKPRLCPRKIIYPTEKLLAASCALPCDDLLKKMMGRELPRNHLHCTTDGSQFRPAGTV